jgi:hypothetical protein
LDLFMRAKIWLRKLFKKNELPTSATSSANMLKSLKPSFFPVQRWKVKESQLCQIFCLWCRKKQKNVAASTHCRILQLGFRTNYSFQKKDIFISNFFDPCFGWIKTFRRLDKMHGRQKQSCENQFLLSEAQPLNVLISPPPQIWKSFYI